MNNVINSVRHNKQAEGAPELWMPVTLRETAQPIRAALAKEFDPRNVNEHSDWRSRVEGIVYNHAFAYLTETQPAPDIMPNANMKAMDQKRADYAKSLQQEAARIGGQILADANRAWEMYVTARALEQATFERDAQKRREDEERWRISMFLCPCCGESDQAQIGAVMHRTLRAGAETVRLCDLCYAVALAALAETVGAATLTDGRTRYAAVTAVMARTL